MADLPPVPPTLVPGPSAVAPSQPSRWPMFTSLVIALAAMGLAIGAWFRPLPNNKPPAAPTYTDQQIANAKTHMCAGFQKVAHALDIADAQNGGSDYTAQLAVATSVRQVLEVGSRYLLTKLAEEPATPPDLATEVRELANLYQEAVVGYLAHVGDSELQPTLRAGDKAAIAINGLCK